MRFGFILSCLIIAAWCFSAHAEYYQYVDKDGVLRFTDEISDVPSSQRPHMTTHESIDKKSDSDVESGQAVPKESMETEEAEPSYAVDQEEPADTDEGRDVAEEPETTADETDAEDYNAAAQYADDETAADQEESQELEEEEDEAVEEPEAEEETAGEEPTIGEEQAEGEAGESTDEQAETETAAESWRATVREEQKKIDARKTELSRRYKTIEAEKAKLGPPPGNNASPAEKTAYNEKVNKVNEKIVQYQTDYTNLEKEVQTLNEQAAKKMRKR
jgi:hypothetical protein